jgi:hypothetical protein
MEIKAQVRLHIGKDGYTEDVNIYIDRSDLIKLAEKKAKKEYQCDEAETKDISISITA